MKLTGVDITNFRNIVSAKTNFGLTNFIIGDNAQGKTNILEALHYLSVGNSFKTRQEEWLVKNGELYGSVQGELTYGEGRQAVIDVVWERTDEETHRQFKLNGTKIARKTLLGTLLTVIFSPDDVSLLRLQPAQRRGFLDSLISRTNKVYHADLLDYTKTLKQRNQLLFLAKLGREDYIEIDAWDNKLAELGSRIIQARLELVEQLNQKIKPFFHALAESAKEFSIVYTADPKFTDPAIYKDKLASIRSIDIKSGHTNFGPHRDDLMLLLNGWDARNTASQGEFRLMILALKLAEGEYIRARFNEMPVYLMDDVFSELDPHKSRALIEFLGNAQAIYTTTDERFVTPEAQVIIVKEGTIIKTQNEFSTTPEFVAEAR
ncbi:MAG: DNA replication and repair protein RecF [Patescibacteria group bacterium]|jgi:DNA replication and repair protein RecF